MLRVGAQEKKLASTGAPDQFQMAAHRALANAASLDRPGESQNTHPSSFENGGKRSRETERGDHQRWYLKQAWAKVSKEVELLGREVHSLQASCP